MKCLNNKKRTSLIFLFIFCFSILSGCTSHRYSTDVPLHINTSVNLPIVRPVSLAKKNVVIPYDSYVYDDDKMEYEAGLLLNQTKNTVVTAVNPHKRIYPASMTKILTAIVVIEAVEKGQISLSDTIVVKKRIEFNEDNVAVMGLEPGDYISVNELLHGLLISSFNDCAVVLARYVSGSVSDFVKLMNQKAAELGATNSHFMNPHGLHDNNHYTTPYDLYLIFQTFLSKDILVQIDSNSTYNLTMYREDEKIQFELKSTNAFLSNSVPLPTGYHITGWKTGTTDKAGSCIILEFVKEDTGEEFICLVSNAKDHEALYKNVEDMLKEIY